METKSLQVLLIMNITSAASTSYTQPPSDLSSVTIPSYAASVSASALSTANQWSVSTAQAGCCGSSSTSISSATDSSLFWLGVGSDCTLPCASSAACELLYGSSYTVASLPSVIAGQCQYAAYQSLATGSSSTNSSSSSYYRASVSAGAVQDISLWGTLNSPRNAPFTLQNQHFQLVSYNNSNMDTHYQGYSQLATAVDLSRLYGQPGDWRDTWPMLPGETLVRAVFNQPEDLYVRTSFLKYADRGMVARVLVADAAAATASSNYSSSTSTNSSSSNSSTSTETSTETSTSSDYCSSSGDSWTYSERIDLGRGVRVVTTSSCPNHFSVCQLQDCGGSAASLAKRHYTAYEVPLYPGFAAVASDATCWVSGPVGVALNGVGIYGPGAGSLSPDGTVVGTYTCGKPSQYGSTKGGLRSSCDLNGQADGTRYCGDAVAKYGLGFDKCGGRADLLEGRYKYQVVPTCLLQQLQLAENASSTYVTSTSTVTVNGTTETFVDLNANSSSASSSSSISGSLSVPSPQVGWALDGFPIYGPIGPHGLAMHPCGTSSAHPLVCLDACNGFRASLPGVVTSLNLDASKVSAEDLQLSQSLAIAWGDGFAYRYYMSGPAGSGECSGIVKNGGLCPRGDSQCCLSELPVSQYFPYSIGCLRGCLANNTLLGGSAGSCSYTSESGTTAAYAPAVSNYPTSIFAGLTISNTSQSYSNLSYTSNTSSTSTSTLSDAAVELARQRLLDGFAYAEAAAARRVLVKFPNGSIALVTTTSTDSSSSVSIEELPTGRNDSMIADIVVDPDTYE
jgi:hypothetical protein